MGDLYDGGCGFFIPTCYANLQPVGRGAFGLVCKADVVPGSVRPDNAYFARLDTSRVAIKKLMSTTAFKDCYHAKQVFREISLLKQLTHENLIKLVDLSMAPNGDLYIVTEAMDCDLAALINSPDFELQEPHVRFITYQILRGLKYMHSAGVLHRDLKPQNILINNTLDARICDLGLARVKAADGLATGYVTTRWYRAPEVMLTWQHYTSALDMWSVGCILAEMLNRLAGRVTFKDPKTGISHYALFPADSHVEHLVLILNTLGVPPPNIIDSINEGSIRTFVTSKIAELQGKQSDLPMLMAGVEEDALALLSGLLHYDPQIRLSADAALENKYLEGYRDPDDEYTRSPIDTSFEGLELPLAMWQELVQKEVQSLSVLCDGAQGDGAFMLEPIPSLSLAFPDLEDGVEDLAALPPVPLSLDPLDLFPGDMSLDPSYQLERLTNTVAQIEAEQQQLLLLYQQAAPGSAARTQLMHSLGEVSARLALYQQSMLEFNS